MAISFYLGVGLAYVLISWALIRYGKGQLKFIAIAAINICFTFYIFFEHSIKAGQAFAIYVATISVFWGCLRLFNWKKGVFFWLAFGLPVAWLVTFKVDAWLPIIGISYMSFRLSYLVYELDSGEIDCPNFFEYLSFAFFTPTFLVGPINPFNFFQKSIQAPSRQRTPIGDSIARIIWGAVKVIVIGSVFSQLDILNMLEDGLHHNTLDVVIAVYCFFFYLYFNFSGLNDIGIGVSGLINVKVKENFNSPFLARNLSEFWNRWHITLGHYMRDIVFNPLSLSLVRNISFIPTRMLIAFSVMVTFALIGIWHGNGLQFLLLGLFHGVGIVIVQYYGVLLAKLPKAVQRFVEVNKVYRVGAIFLTITYVSAVSTLMVFDFKDYRHVYTHIMLHEKEVG